LPEKNRIVKHLYLLLLTCFALNSAIAQDAPEIDLTEAALRGPAVASVLEMPRDTPAEQLSAIFTLIDLGEPDIAAALWKDFAAADLEDETKATLVNQFGAARFLNLARRETATEMTGARKFADGCLAAAAAANTDPQRLAKLIDDLSDPSAAVQQAARSDLSVTGDAGAAACLAALAQAAKAKAADDKADDDEAGKQLRTQLLLTLAKMRPGVEPMLIAALADGRGQFRRDVVELAGYLHLQDAVPWLAAIAAGADTDPVTVAAAHASLAKMGLSSPTDNDAQAVILHAINRLEMQEHPPTPNTPWWSYNAEQKKLIGRDVSAKQLRLLQVARLAQLLAQLPNASSPHRGLALIYAYQAADVLGQPLPSNMQQWAATLATSDLSEMLAEALERNQFVAAVACANLLGERADASALKSFASQRSPLATALVHAEGNVRYAALEAVMKIGPTTTFAGASGVPKALWHFAASAGTPQAIAAASVVTRASDWAGQLRGAGYDATPAGSGREALQLALRSPRLELVLVDSDIGQPLLREVVYQLRSSSQTSRVPIAILSSLHNLPRAERLAEGDRWLLATPRPHSDEAMTDVLARLTKLKRGSQADAPIRTEQAAAALNWLAQLLADGHPYDELLRDADLVSGTLYEPELTKPSLRLLAVLGTAGSQQLLLDYVSSNALPIETRRLAVAALAKNAERFGKLLTTAELTRQYDRYNASETADSDTQEVLGQVLDILEK